VLRLKLTVSACLEWNGLRSLSSVSAWLECVVVKILSISMSGMFCDQNNQFQYWWDMSWSKLSVSACLECIESKIVSFSMDNMCCGCKIVSFSMTVMERDVFIIVSFSMSWMQCVQNRHRVHRFLNGGTLFWAGRKRKIGGNYCKTIHFDHFSWHKSSKTPKTHLSYLFRLVLRDIKHFFRDLGAYFGLF
jgi:hypothetical protein